MKALVVEDDEIVRKLMKAYLEDIYQLTIAKDGPEGLAAFKKAADEGAPFSLVCVDIMMPQMNGVDVLKKIREIENEHEMYGDAASRVLMVTAVVDKNTVAQAFREGCDGYVIKPLERSELIRQLGALRLLPDGYGQTAPRASSGKHVVDED